jgi:ABC-2 type transport system ATP-binding protein
MIEVERLHVRYPRTERPAVDGISFSVPKGQVFGFIGPNGAGKTTTLRVLSALLAPDSGKVRVCGLDVRAKPDAVRSRVGFLPDFFGVPESLSCVEYLELHAALQGVPPAEREPAIQGALELTDLREKADVRADSLSRGMLQRLGLARVLLHEPDVLLLDEPASGLDPRARVEVREVLRELGRLGKTIFVSSHVLADLAAVCEAVGIMERGRLVHAGSIGETLELASSRVEAVVLTLAAEGVEATRRALEADGTLGALIEEGEHDVLRVTLPGGVNEPAARVAAALSTAGLTAVHLELEALDLERAFLALTQGRLA